MLKLAYKHRLSKVLCLSAVLLVILTGCNSDDNNDFNTDASSDINLEQYLPNNSSSDSNINVTTKAADTTTTQPTTTSKASTTTPAPAPKPTVEFMVRPGDTVARVALNLEAAGICSSKSFLAATNSGKFEKFSLISKIKVGIDKRPFRVEGYLGPTTYVFEKGQDPVSIITEMIKARNDYLVTNYTTQVSKSGHTFDQIIIIASIIEKESGGSSYSDKSLVSAVIRNRLRDGDYLSMCSTVNYVKGAVNDYVLNDIKYGQFINTYHMDGLPSSPICTPSIYSIKAALNPNSNTTYKYFASDDNDKLYFSVKQDEIKAICKEHDIPINTNQVD